MMTHLLKHDRHIFVSFDNFPGMFVVISRYLFNSATNVMISMKKQNVGYE